MSSAKVEISFSFWHFLRRMCQILRKTTSFILPTFRTLLKGFVFLVMLLFFGHMLLFFENHNFMFLKEVDPILPLQVWDFGGSGLRRVRILKNDISFSILMISVSFWTLQAWDSGGSGLRRVRILKNDISFSILMISVSFWHPTTKNQNKMPLKTKKKCH